MEFINPKNILFIDGIFLIIIGFAQTLNSFLGYQYGLGGYKVLNKIRFAAMGIFEMNFMIGLIGVILIYSAINEHNLIFWFAIACITHSFIGVTNIIFWKDTFVVNNAEFNGKIATIIHVVIAAINCIVFLTLLTIA